MGPSGLCQTLEMQEGREKVGAEDPDLALPGVCVSAEPGGEGSLTVGMELNPGKSPNSRSISQVSSQNNGAVKRHDLQCQQVFN